MSGKSNPSVGDAAVATCTSTDLADCLSWVTALLGWEVYTRRQACLRWKPGHGDAMRQEFLPCTDTIAIAERLLELGREHDVYLAVAPRDGFEGGAAGVPHAWVIWVDADGREAVRALERFKPSPSMIVYTGPDGAHGYWILSDLLEPEWVVKANGRLARAIGGDPKSTDIARILRSPGTLSFKHGGFPVTLGLLDEEALYDVRGVVGDLPDPPVQADELPHRHRPVYDASDDLERIHPPEYVRQLGNVECPDAGGPIRCPLPGHEDRHPSFSVSPDAARGWRCHGACDRGGGIYQFAGALAGKEGRLRGEDFLAVKEAVRRTFS